MYESSLGAGAADLKTTGMLSHSFSFLKWINYSSHYSYLYVRHSQHHSRRSLILSCEELHVASVPAGMHPFFFAHCEFNLRFSVDDILE